MSRFRVGLVVPRFAPFRGGVETYVAAAATALAARDVDVTVVTQAPKAAMLPKTEECGGYIVERHHLPVADVYDVPSPAAAHAASRRGRFDVVWVHSYHTPLAWLVSERTHEPLVFTPHYHGVGHTAARQAIHRFYRPAGRRLMAASRRIVVDTDAEADLVLSDFPQQVQPAKVSVIAPMVTDPTRGRRHMCHPPVVLTVARQESYKRTDLLIRAIAACRDRGVAARLVVVGDGSATTTYQDVAATVGAKDVVTFTGAVDDDTLAMWWACASVYATASEQEAYGIGLAEALIAGIPAAASDIPAHREVVRRAGPVAARLCATDVPDGQAAAEFACGIVDLLADGGSRAERAALCALPDTDEVADQLVQTLAAVSQRARL